MPPKKAPRQWAKQNAMRILERMEQAAQQKEAARLKIPGLRLADRQLTSAASNTYPITSRGRLETGPEGFLPDAAIPGGLTSREVSRPPSKEPLSERDGDTARKPRPRMHLHLRIKKNTLGDVVKDITKRKLSVDEEASKEDAMDIDSPVKSLRSHGRKNKANDNSAKQETGMNTSRHRGKEKGTVVWRVQPEMGDIVVRETQTAGGDPNITLEQAIKMAKPGARIFVQGNHSWSGTLVLDKTIQIVGAGAWVTCLSGRWLLQDQELDAAGQSMGCQEAFDSIRPMIGGFSGIHLSNRAGHGRRMTLPGNYMTETLVIRQGSWRFHSCKITAGGSPPMLLSGKADVKALECRIGGVGSGELRSSSGVIVTGESRCELHTCVIENTDDDSYTEVAHCAGVRRSMPAEHWSPFAQQYGLPSVPSPVLDHSLGAIASPDASFLGATPLSGRRHRLTEDNFHSTSVLVRHTASVQIDCCKFVHNYVALTIADCAHAVVNNSLFHEHNNGAIFGILSAGDHVRESILEVKDNKIARSQDKHRTAIGRPGRYNRKDGLGTWEELEPDVRRALARLETLFETESVLFTTMSLSIK